MENKINTNRKNSAGAKLNRSLIMVLVVGHSSLVDTAAEQSAVSFDETSRVTVFGNGRAAQVIDSPQALISISSATAGGIEISGRITTPDGRGLRNADVTITDQIGNRQTVTTGSFGHYSFTKLEGGASYTITVGSRRYKFTPRRIEPTDSLAGVDFVGRE